MGVKRAPVLALLLAATPALAQTQAYRLSQAEIDATVAAASYKAETSSLLPQVAAAPLSLPHLPPAGIDVPVSGDRRVHGTAGFAVSSDGGFALFGSTAVPLGEESWLSLSYSYSRIPNSYLLPYGGLAGPAIPVVRR